MGGAIEQAEKNRALRVQKTNETHRREEFILELNKLVELAATGNSDAASTDQYGDFAVRVGENERLRIALKLAKSKNNSLFLWNLSSWIVEEDIYLCHMDSDDEIIKFLLG